MSGQNVVKGLFHQRGLAGAGDAGDADKNSQRQGDVDAFEIVSLSSVDF